MPYTLRKFITTEGGSASNEKRLSICLAADGFSFSETTADGLLLTFGEAHGSHAATMTDITGEVKALFAEAGIRPLGHKHLELVVVSNESVWVPDEMYSSLSNRQYLRLVGGRELSVMTCRSSALASTAVFAADEQLVMAFKVALPGVTVLNQHAKMATLAPRSAGHPVMATNWRKGRVDVAAFAGGRYLFGNTLRFVNNEEAIFHTVEVMKGQGLEQPDTEMLIFGDVDREFYAQLRPYFPKVTLYSGETTRFENPEFRTLHTYRHALLFF